MKKSVSIILFVPILFSMILSDVSAFKMGGKEMFKNGTGKRTMFLIGTVYYATLYVPEGLKGKSGKKIIDADEPMSVILTIDTRFLTRDKFVKATREGFQKAAKSGYPTKKSKIFLNLFTPDMKINKHDRVYLNYYPGKGIVVKMKPKATGKIKTLGIVKGLNVKKALFAIWLGTNPVQGSCKKGMLGK